MTADHKARYHDIDKLADMIRAKADTLIEGKEAFLYVAKWLDQLPPADVVPKSEVDNLEYKLMGVMHSVDKWLEGDELGQDEVNRAATMREKTLRIIEAATAEIDRLKEKLNATIAGQETLQKFISTATPNKAITYFAERLKEKHCERLGCFGGTYRLTGNDIDALVKEMTEAGSYIKDLRTMTPEERERHYLGKWVTGTEEAP